jgi:hypothetical protein
MNIVIILRSMKLKDILGPDFLQYRSKLKKIETLSKQNSCFICPIKIFFVIVIAQPIMALVVDELWFGHSNQATIGRDCLLVVKGIVNERLDIPLFLFEITILWVWLNFGGRNDVGFRRKY